MVEGTPTLFEVAVEGGPLAVARFGTGAQVVLGLHGITGSHMQLLPLARRLGPEFSLVAPDLRGRGASNRLPGPYGMLAHARDCAAVLAQVADGPVVVVGQSMGGYVAVLLAADYPELVERLVLADGGIPLPVPPGVDVDAVLDAVLGPALARLRQVFPTEQSYVEFWQAHPAVGEQWTADVEAYVRYDLEPTEGGFKSRALEEAVRVDGGQHVREPDLVASHLRKVQCPVALIRAERNLLNQPMPMLPDEGVAPWHDILPDFTDEMVGDTNHYTLMFGDRGTTRMAEHLTGRPRG